MALFNILKGKKKEDPRGERLERSRSTIRGFLKEVGVKRSKSTGRKDEHLSRYYDNPIDQAGRICYRMVESTCPKYEKTVAGKPTPKNLIKKKQRDEAVCEIADKFAGYVDFFLEHRGTEDLEYGIIDKSMDTYPEDQGKYDDHAKANAQAKLNLPSGSDLDHFKNYSIKYAATQIESTLSAFLGYLSHSGIAQEIQSTPGQLEAFEDFVMSAGREVAKKVESLPRHQESRDQLYEDNKKQLINGELEKRNQLAKGIKIIKETLVKTMRDYEEQKKKLIEAGVDPENIPSSVIGNAREIGEFISETGRYKSQRIIEEEKQRQTAREVKRKSGLTSIHENQVQQKTEYIDQEAFFRQSRPYKQPTQSFKKEDSSAFWGDTDQSKE